MSFDDPINSQKIRDAITKIAKSVVKEEGVTYRYGTVVAIDYAGSRVTVQFPGQATTVPVKTLGIQPTGTGQIVQVSTVKGDHFVTGVLGQASLQGADPNDVSAPTVTLSAYTESVVANWSVVGAAAAYEIEFATDSQFQFGTETYQIGGNQFTYTTTATDQDIWCRVRALTYHDPPQAGPWSETAGPAQPQAIAVPSDGSTPSDSPDVAVVPGLGFLQARWSPQDNADPVTYEVHINTTSNFTPNAGSLYDETSGLTSFIRTTGDGSPLEYDTTYYVRILAKDKDGKAPVAGAQDSAQISRIDTGDAGNIGIDNVSDGSVPSTSPAVGSVTGGIGYLYVTWGRTPNDDPVTYEVHMSNQSGFAPDFNTYIGDTPSTFYMIREQGQGWSRAPLKHAVTYYIKIIAKDADGYAASFGAQGSGAIVKAQTADFAVGSITAGSGVIANAAIGAAQIQNAAITQAKIADAQISNAKIQNLAVTNAKITDLDVAKVSAGTLTAEWIIGTGSISALGSIGEVVIDGDGIRAWNNTVRSGTPVVSFLTSSNFGKPKLSMTYDTGSILSVGHNVTHSGFGEVVAGINFTDGTYGSNYWYVYTSDGAGTTGRTRFRVGDGTSYIAFDTDTGLMEVKAQTTLQGGSTIIGATTISGDVSISGGELNVLGGSGEFLLDDNGLRLWPNTGRTGTPSVYLNAATGDASFTGDITGSTITGSTITVADTVATVDYEWSISLDGVQTFEVDSVVMGKIYAVYDDGNNTRDGIRISSSSTVVRDDYIFDTGLSWIDITDDYIEGWTSKSGTGESSAFRIDPDPFGLTYIDADSPLTLASDAGGQLDLGDTAGLAELSGSTVEMNALSGSSSLSGGTGSTEIIAGSEDMLFRTNSTERLRYDHSQARWEFATEVLFNQNRPLILNSGTDNTVMAMDTWTSLIIVGVSPGGIRSKNPDASAWREMEASAFTINSDRRRKTNITPVADEDVLDMVRGGRGKAVARFRRESDDDYVREGLEPPIELGLIAQEMPPEVMRDMDGDGSDFGISLSSLAAFHHRAIEQIVERLDAAGL